jgi:hypothetical protein
MLGPAISRNPIFRVLAFSWTDKNNDLCILVCKNHANSNGWEVQ